MKTQMMLVGGPHNGSLFSYTHDGAEPPLHFHVAYVEDIVTGKVPVSKYRLRAHDKVGPVSQAAYLFLDVGTKREGLVERYLSRGQSEQTTTQKTGA